MSVTSTWLPTPDAGDAATQRWAGLAKTIEALQRSGCRVTSATALSELAFEIDDSLDEPERMTSGVEPRYLTERQTFATLLRTFYLDTQGNEHTALWQSTEQPFDVPIGPRLREYLDDYYFMQGKTLISAQLIIEREHPLDIDLVLGVIEPSENVVPMTRCRGI
jgi:hypothetical protein